METLNNNSSRFPFGIPNSWFHLACSDEVPQGRALTVPAFGTNLVVFRGDDGNARIFEPSGDPSATAAVRDWRTCERNGLIFAYHGTDGTSPGFEIPVIPECDSRQWLPVGRIDATFRSHIQEVVENSVDLGHFRYLHTFAEHARLLQFEMKETWFRVKVGADKLVFGVRRPIELSIDYHGMGFAVGRVAGPFPFLSLVTGLPIDGERLRLRLMMWVRVPRLPLLRNVISPLLRWHVRRDLREELTVLEHKRYLEAPILAAGDGPIMKVRRWCRQFYGKDAEPSQRCAREPT